MKRYKAIFFDWDGTAVMSRKAPVEEAVSAMKPLLSAGIKLVIVSGTTIENIGGGRLASYFTAKELSSLYMGLGRGAYNYAFREDGSAYTFSDMIPDKKRLGEIHKICFDIHMELLEQYGLNTDIVFSRPNYCKIDLMADNQRGENLFMQATEVESLKKSLENHGIKGGLQELLAIAEETGKRYGVNVSATCDAKYLEVGISSKSHNADTIFTKLSEEYGIQPEECAYWGDEYVGVEPGIYGSDSFMKTETTGNGDFFDVSEIQGERPEGVQQVGGGVVRFLSFLREQKEG